MNQALRLTSSPTSRRPDAKRERVSGRPQTQRLTPMPTPSSLPQRSRIALLSRRSSSPNRRSRLHIGHSPPPLVTPFRINTCKSVTKQTTLTPFRINTYAKPGEGGPHPVCSVLPRQGPSFGTLPNSLPRFMHLSASHLSTLTHHAPSSSSPLDCARRSAGRLWFSFCAIACYRPHQQGGF
jgi:hypothetical protein